MRRPVARPQSHVEAEPPTTSTSSTQPSIGSSGDLLHRITGVGRHGRDERPWSYDCTIDGVGGADHPFLLILYRTAASVSEEIIRAHFRGGAPRANVSKGGSGCIPDIALHC